MQTIHHVDEVKRLAGFLIAVQVVAVAVGAGAVAEPGGDWNGEAPARSQ